MTVGAEPVLSGRAQPGAAHEIARTISSAARASEKPRARVSKRILEVISPGGFEHFFDEVAAGAGTPDELGARYRLEFDFESVPRLCEEHGLTLPLNA